MTSSNPTISAAELARLVSALGDAPPIPDCIAALRREGTTIDLVGGGSRAELLRIYARRERTAHRTGVIVAGGASLVESLAASTAESILMAQIKDNHWSGIIFLQELPQQRCLGCIGRAAD